MGINAKLIASEFVQLFRKSAATKKDKSDVEAIAISSRQATMRYVSVKSIAQKEALVWHRLREGDK